MKDKKSKPTSIMIITEKENKKDEKKTVTVNLGKVDIKKKENPIPVVDKQVDEVQNQTDDINILKILSGQEGIIVYHVVYGNVVITNVTNDRIYFHTSKILGMNEFVDAYGKKYDYGECLIFPSYDERDWLKFKPNKLNPGDYVVIGNNKCILRKELGNEVSSHGMMFDVAVAIAGEDDLYPNKIELNHIFHTFRNKVRMATEGEIKEINDILSKEGLVWNKDTMSIDVNKWYPKQDEVYYSLLIKGACRFFVIEAKWDGTSVDIDRYENGNCFKTREEANHWCAKFNNSSEEVSKQLINR